MIQGTMSDEDLKKLRELQEKIDESNTALESKFINEEEEDPLEDPVERIHHELEAYGNSIAVEKAQVVTAPGNYNENPLPPPPPETNFSRSAEGAYEPLSTQVEYDQISLQQSKELKRSIVGSMDGFLTEVSAQEVSGTHDLAGQNSPSCHLDQNRLLDHLLLASTSASK